MVEFHEGGRMAAILGRGAFVGDIDGILRGPRSFEAGAPAVGLGEQPMQLVVTQAGRAFRIMAAGLAGFLDNNPKVLLALSGSHFVE